MSHVHYKVVGYMSNDGKLTWEEERALHAELLAARDALAEAERQAAYAAVQATLASYRWWGWTNIVNSVRIWLQSRSFWRKSV